jgi:guanylate kinase
MLILVGPSASGKTEATKILIQKYNLKKLVTYTTRNMRVHEVNGKDYHFISKEEFMDKINNNFFIEYVEYNGNFYGTSREDLSKDKVVILEPAGVKAYVQKAKELIKICYLRTSIEYRLKRMIARMDDPKEIEKRIQNDDLIFNKELETLADWVIDSNDISLEDLTEQIYQLYKPFV